MTPHRAERAYLHIGSPKTATSTIQHFLFHNADALQKQGYLFPRSAGPPNQTYLATYATGARVNQTRKRPANVARMRRKIESGLADEISLKRPRNLIFSNEHLFSRTKRPAQIARVRELMSTIADEVTVVVYLREPSSFLASLYSTAVRHGTVLEFPEFADWMLEPGRMAHFDERLQRWADHFGADRILVRPFSRSTLHEKGVLHDFVETVDLAWSDDFVVPEDANPSLSSEGIELLRRVNVLLDEDETTLIGNDRERLAALLEGPPMTRRLGLTAEMRAEHGETFDQIVDSVAQKYLDGVAMFPDADDEPETDDNDPSFSSDEVFDFAAAVLRDECRLHLVERAERQLWQALYLESVGRPKASEDILGEVAKALDECRHRDGETVDSATSIDLADLALGVIEVGSLDRELIAELTRQLSARGRIEDAREVIEAAIESAHRLLPLWEVYADVLHRCGETERARNVLRDALATNPDVVSIRTALERLD